MTHKTSILISTAVVFLSALHTPANAEPQTLKIDFTQTGGPVQAGYQGYFALQEQISSFVPQTYTAFGTTVTITPSWAPGAVNATTQMYDRGGDDGTDTPNLLRDWIGTDNRQPGNPLTITISGLPSGSYSWLSYHHDPENQTGLFDVTINDATGSTTATNIDISDTRSTGITDLASATTFTTDIVSDGSEITIAFSQQASSPVEAAFFLMNAMILEAQNPCYNAPPNIEGPQALAAFSGETVLLDVSVTDDGKPYIEGCNPDQPNEGTAIGLSYLWSQISGPAPVEIAPLSADVEDVNVTLPQTGTYEMQLVVWDGPLSSSPEGGKITQYTVTIEALQPLYGDVDRNQTVDFLDVRLFSQQWLDEPACMDAVYCADFDGDGAVSGADFALMSGNWLADTARLVISEFVASNSTGLLDGDGNTSDWIELHNPTDAPVSLDGWHLTDDPLNPNKWPLPPETVLGADEYMLIFASDQPVDDYVDPKGYPHANFALDRGGEYLALTNPSGKTVHSFGEEFPPQQADISYGMWYSLFRYFGVPTPGAPNKEAFLGFTDKTSHSKSRGFYDQPFILHLYTDTPSAMIRYTLDGSEPSEQHGKIYDPDDPIVVTTTTVVRSVAFKAGWKPGDVSTHTYVFPDKVANQPADPPGWPQNWGYDSEVNGRVPADYEMDPRVVDSTLPGYSVREALLDIPTVSIAMLPDDFISDASGIYANPKSRTEKKCSIEYFEPESTDDFQHDCKIEVHGNSSRRPWRMQKHSLRLTFTSLYGPAKLKYELFGESPVETFNQLVLRACFTDSWGLVSWSDSRYRPNDSQYIRDVWMKESLRDMGQPSSYGKFVHLYVNGLYFGIHNMTERIKGDFFAFHLGGEPEHWEINEDLSSPGARWNAMMGINPSTLAGYKQMLEYLDVEDFADYMLLHFYADAEDWPHHNGYAAANAVSGDGKFRFFVWDQEIVLDYHGRAASRIDRTGGVGTLFQKMRTSDEFRMLFADRVYKHCFNNGALSLNGSTSRYLEIANWIDKAIVAESARWGDVQVSTPYGNSIRQPSPLDDINHNLYPPAPHGPDYYFTREDSWLIERDNIINNYIPAIHDDNNSYAIINLLKRENLYPDIDPPVFSVNGVARHGGYISTGDSLTLTNPNAGGTVYYTTDGTDPRVPASAEPGQFTTLVAESAPKRVLVPTGPVSSDWTGGAEPFDDSQWISGTGGVGYEVSSGYQAFISIDVIQMRNSNETCYIRIPFTVDSGDLDGSNVLNLNIRYDDGFIAYLNGVRVYSTEGAPADPTWNSGAPSSHSDSEAIVLRTCDITTHLGVLQPGENILAIHGLNYTAGSTDFLISAELVTGTGGSPAGGVSPDAKVYSGPLALNGSTAVNARVLSGVTWSPLAQTVFATESTHRNLRITELMYHPEETGDPEDPNAEYIELQNIGISPIDLNLVRFDNGVEFTFGKRQLPAGQRILLVRNRSVFESRYSGLSDIIAGEYEGRLDDAGERIELIDAAGTTIHSFRYRDGWYDLTDGRGFSLTVRQPETQDLSLWNQKDGWRPSALPGGSPGFDDSGLIPEPGTVVINEVLAHSHAAAPDWIELRNTSDQVVNIGGWYLSDSDSDDAARMKYRIPAGTSIERRGYVVFYEDVHFGSASTDPGAIIPFALSENGEEIVLSSAQDGVLTGYRDYEDFGASPTGIAFGRHAKSDGEFNFVAMSANTPGSANAYPKVGPLVITEIMYNPLSGDENEEFVELYNTTSSPLILYDSTTNEPWKFTDGIELTFGPSPAVVIPAHEYILAVKDLPTFTAAYGSPPAGVQIFEYDSGRLDNGGEKLEISMPGDVDSTGDRQYIRIDRINYSDGSHPAGEDPWPVAADGGGASLTRIDPTAYGNDVINWKAEPPTPGR